MTISTVFWVFLGVVAIQSSCFGDYSPNWVWEDEKYADFAIYSDQTPDGTTQIVACPRTESQGGEDSCIAVFNWQSPWPVHFDVFPNLYVNTIAISDDGSRFAYTTFYTEELYVLAASGDPLWDSDVSTYGNPCAITFNPTGDILFVGFRNPGRLVLFDTMTGEEIWSGYYGSFRVIKIDVSNNGRWVLLTLRTGSTPTPARVALYDLFSQTPDEPIFDAEVADNSSSTHAALALDAENFVVTARTWFEYHDFTLPVGDVKEPKWELDGGGYPGLKSMCGISNDGSIAGYHGPGLDNTDGHARVFQSDGIELFSMITDFRAAEIAVSGDGSRIAFSGSSLDYGYEGGRVYVWEQSTNDLLCELNTFGPVHLNDDGQHLFVFSGRDTNQIWSRPSLFILEDNDPPQCAIVEPVTGSSVTSVIELAGMADDVDDDIIKIEILSPAGLTLAVPKDETLHSWQASVDLSEIEPGEITLKARAVDGRYKHGQWHEITLSVQATPTPSPLPTYTPTPTPTLPPGVTPTPNQPEPLYLQLLMPQKLYQPDDVFYLDAQVINSDQGYRQTAFVVLLEIHGIYFTLPSWSVLDGVRSLDYFIRDIPQGETSIEIIPEFFWPDTETGNVGLIFYGLILSQDFGVTLSNLDLILWSYQP